MSVRSEIIDHSKQVFLVDVCQLQEHEQAIRRAIGSDAWYANYVANPFRKLELYPGEDPMEHYRIYPEQPRLSLEMLGVAYADIRDATLKSDSLRRDRFDRLAGIINDVLLPMTGLKMNDEEPINGRPSKEAMFSLACGTSERYFDGARKQTNAGRYYNQDIIRVYHDESRRPIIFRKSQGESTGLTLVDTLIEGSAVPAGSIVSLDPTMSDEDKITGQKERCHDLVESYLIEELLMLPERISAWAYPNVLDRALFTIYGLVRKPEFRRNRETVRAITKQNLDSFREAARRVIAICQPSAP